MAWTNPRWGSLIGPDADVLRGIFESLSEWTRNPTFGNATSPTVAGGGLVQVQPAALTVQNEWIQSANFVAGSAGWQIKANGDAEFNNITIRGTFKTASTGRRVEIGTSGDVTSAKFFSGDVNEDAPGRITTEAGTGIQLFRLYGVRMFGGTQGYYSIFNEFHTVAGRLSVSQTGMPNTTSTDRALSVFGGAGGWAASFSGHVDITSNGNLVVGGYTAAGFGNPRFKVLRFGPFNLDGSGNIAVGPHGLPAGHNVLLVQAWYKGNSGEAVIMPTVAVDGANVYASGGIAGRACTITIMYTDQVVSW